MVKREEMAHVLRVVKEMSGLKARQWVRLKRGIFKDDLGEIDFVEPSQNMVHLKLLPRIDYTRNRGVLKNTQTSVSSVLDFSKLGFEKKLQVLLAGCCWCRLLCLHCCLVMMMMVIGVGDDNIASNSTASLVEIHFY